MGEATIAEKIMVANADLRERLEALDLRVSYDEEFDIFLIAIGDPQEAITEEIDGAHGLQFRVDPETLKIVGFEIMGFRKRYLAAHPEFMPHFQALFKKEPIEKREIPASERKQAQEALRALAPAFG